MLTEISRLNHVGIFRAGVHAHHPVRLQRTTLFYGENGRGKSTLCAVFDSYARNKPALIQARATLDEANPRPEATLIFQGRGPAAYDNATWAQHFHEMRVFDSQFVNDNVYTGAEVTSNNRKGLYEFALGDQAADLGRLEALNQESRQANQHLTELEQAVAIIAGPYLVPEFVSLQTDPNIQGLIDSGRQEVNATERNEQTIARQDLARIALPELIVRDMFGTLRRVLIGLNDDSLQQVRDHFTKHPGRGIERWVGEGLDYTPRPECPFCGQETEHVALLQAFNTYYSDGFRQLNAAVAAAARVAREHVSIANVTNLQTTITANEPRRQLWLDLVPSEEIPFDMAATVEDGRELHQLIERLFEAKVASLPDPIGTEAEEARARELQARILERIRAYNLRVDQLNAQYADRKRAIEGADLNELRLQVRRLEVQQRRGTPEALTLIAQYEDAVAIAEQASTDKAAVRDQLNTRMATLLERYQGAINGRLSQLHARFRIVALETTRDGGQAPRTGYRLELRGRQIAAQVADANRPSFATVLSDGDRRTMALAFFLAHLDLAPNLQDKIVVFDDPMTSFDADRRRTTVEIIASLSQRCAQVIVLSHDAHFLNAVREAIDDTGNVCAVHRIGFHGDDAVFSSLDLGDECQTPYMRLYKRVWNFLYGPPPHDLEKVAPALRRLVEGYYKLRFPSEIHHSANLGKIRAQIEEAQPNTPLGRLQHLLGALARFDEFSSQDHHVDPNDPGAVQLHDVLRRYAFAAMSLVHDDGNSFPVPR